MEVPPFTYCGVELRLRVMNSCGDHIEVTHSLDTDCYILALRRMIARRGNIRTIYSDNGSNFIRAENELKKALEEMDDKKIKLLYKNLVVIGLSGSETHLLQATWVVSGKGKYAQQEEFYDH